MESQKISMLISIWAKAITEIVTITNMAIIQWRKNKKKNVKRVIGIMGSNLSIIPLGRRRRPNEVRNQDWWVRIVRNECSEEDWIENFRMSQSTFDFICNLLDDALKPKFNKITITRRDNYILDTKKKVAMALFYLARSCEYGKISHLFGVHKSTVSHVLHEFIMAVNAILLPKYLRMPSEEEAVNISNCFERLSGIPNIVGAINETHIPILIPPNAHDLWENTNGWPSLVLKAVVDSNCKFINVKISNSQETDNKYKYIEDFLPKGRVKIGNSSLPFVIVGDSSFPNLKWLIKPFSTDVDTTQMATSFNTYLNSAGVASKVALQRLKARWGILLNRIDINHDFVPHLVTCCCTLHNILEERNETFLPEWLDQIEEVETVFPQPKKYKSEACYSSDGVLIRKKLCDYLQGNLSRKLVVN